MQPKNEPKTPAQPATKSAKPTWEKPVMQEVSQKVMAQPYIRFT